MKILRGDIWLTNFDPIIGSEIAKTRPAIVISHSGFNLKARTVTVLPISSGKFIRSFHVNINNLKQDSHAIIPQMRVADRERLIKKIGEATSNEIREIETKILRYLDIRK